jgi:hypothetical protein
MTNSTSARPEDAIVTPPTAEEGRKILLKEIGSKWNKFSEQETTAMKSKDDLVTQLVAKYSMEKAQAQHDADAFLKGRQF